MASCTAKSVLSRSLFSRRFSSTAVRTSSGSRSFRYTKRKMGGSAAVDTHSAKECSRSLSFFPSRTTSKRTSRSSSPDGSSTGLTKRSGLTPTDWIERSEGRRYWAMDSLRALPSDRSNICWTLPLPKVCVPTRMARSRYLKAPETISLAEAEPWLMSTTMGIRPSVRHPRA